MAISVLGGFWAQYGATMTQISGNTANKFDARKALGRKSTYALRALMTALNGVAAGSNATKTLKRVENNVELGGKRIVETETLINRNTTAADVTAITNSLLTFSTRTYTASPVANGDGNPLGTR